jgi:threonine dehydrogenase-like Zn-dependent dehydrogenase
MFAASDNTCPHCRAGYQSSCIHREFITRAQAPLLRVPLADGTLVPTPGMPSEDLIPSPLTISDVFGTGWFAADAANVKPGMTVAVVGDGAVGARVKELTDGIGADAVLECVGTQESMIQAIHSTRPGGGVGYVGVPYEAKLDFISPGGGGGLFFSHVRLHGGPAPVRRFLPELIDLVWNRKINPGKVFDLTLPLEEVAEGYRAMDQPRAIKALLRP